jgi:hypothetical protein
MFVNPGLRTTNATDLFIMYEQHIRSQWPCGLRYELSMPAPTEIMSSNLTGGMDGYLRLFCVCVLLCVGRGLASG